MSKYLSFLMFFLLFVHATASAAASIEKSLVGTQLSIARKSLLESGWKPIKAKSPKEDDPDFLGFQSAKDLHKMGFNEVSFCSGTGLNYCWATYKKGSHCLSLQTQGEGNPVVYRSVDTCHPN
jgi:hypothetical protein